MAICLSLSYKLSILQEILHMVKINFIFVHCLLLILFDQTPDVIYKLFLEKCTRILYVKISI